MRRSGTAVRVGGPRARAASAARDARSGYTGIGPLVLGIAATLFAACDSEPMVPEGPRIELTPGSVTTDTIGAVLTEPLTIEVFDGTRPRAGVTVQLAQVNPVLGAGPTVLTFSETPEDPGSGGITLETDELGRAQVWIRLGWWAGEVRVTARTTLPILEASTTYRVLPGAPQGLGLYPRDTTVAVERAFTFFRTVVDRGGNATTHPATFTARGDVSVTASGAVRGDRVGNGVVRVQAEVGGAMLADSIRVGVVPRGRLSLGRLNGPARVRWSDGRAMSVKEMATPALSPRSDSIAFIWGPDLTPPWAGPARLWVTDPQRSGGTLPIAPFTDPAFPHFTADGEWIYFQARPPNRDPQVFRIRPNGFDLEEGGRHAEKPSPSPDGDEAVYVRFGRLFIWDTRTGDHRSIPNTFYSDLPRWSPDGEWIAFTRYDTRRVWLVRPDGADMQMLIDVDFDQAVAWSPDSRYLLATRSTNSWLIEVSSGRVIELPMRVDRWSYGSWVPELP